MSKKVETAEDVRKLTDEEVGVELSRLRNQLFALRTQAVTGKVENVADFKITRRSIARLLTEKNARRHRKSAAAKPAAKPAAKAKAVADAGPAKGGSTKPVAKKAASAKTRPSARKATKTK